jgi:hypothetical protein
MAERGWQQRFDDPIPLPRDRQQSHPRDGVTGVGIAFFWAPMRRRVMVLGKHCQFSETG